ncbi:MAG: hypothetical protein JWL61_5304 [Gemmatimonadetes bacterium]|nr:hypothetical protein [Gemmatimonadota bacterium]
MSATNHGSFTVIQPLCPTHGVAMQLRVVMAAATTVGAGHEIQLLVCPRCEETRVRLKYPPLPVCGLAMPRTNPPGMFTCALPPGHAEEWHDTGKGICGDPNAHAFWRDDVAQLPVRDELRIAAINVLACFARAKLLGTITYTPTWGSDYSEALERLRVALGGSEVRS